MATLRYRKLAAFLRETPEYIRNNHSQNTPNPRMTEEYIGQVSEESEGRVIKKLSKEFSRTQSRFLAALSKIDEILLNPQVQAVSGAVAGTSTGNG